LVAYNESKVLEKQVALLQVQLKAQGLARIAYDGERTLGKRSLLDVLDSQNEYFDTQRALARAKTGLILARAKALAEAGSLLAAFGVSIVRPDSLDWQWDPALSSAYAQCPSVPTEAIDVDFEDIYDRLQRSAGS
jgi:adhesin transport system outer membrane protein